MDTTWQMYAGNDFFRRCKPDEGIVLFLDKFFLVAGKDQTTAIALPPDGELSRQLIDDHWMNNLHLLPVLGPLSRDGEYVAPVTGDPWATNHPGVRVHPEWLWRFNDPTWGVGAGCYSQGFDKGMEGFAIYGENIFVAGSDKGGYEAVFLPKDPSHRYRVMQAHWWKMLPTMPILGEMSRPLARPPGYTKRLGLNRMRGAPSN